MKKRSKSHIIDFKIVKDIETLTVELGAVLSKFLNDRNMRYARNVGTNAICNILTKHIKVVGEDLEDQYELLDAIDSNISRMLTMGVLNNIDKTKCEACGEIHEDDQDESSEEDEGDTTEHNDNKKYKVD